MKKIIILTMMFFLGGRNILLALPTPSFNSEDSMIQLFEDETDQIVVAQMPFEMNLPSFGIGSDIDKDLSSIVKPPFIQNYFDQVAGGTPFHSSKLIEGGHVTIPQGISLQIQTANPKSVESWRANVVDSRGAVIKTLSGKGIPPSPIKWDGQDDGWMRIQTNEPYNFIYDAMNKDGSTSHQVGTPQKFPYFSLIQNKSLAIMMASQELFSHDVSPDFSIEGKSLMMTACDSLARYPSHPVLVNIFSADLKRAQKEASVIKNFIDTVLMKNPDEVTTDIQVDPNETETIKIQVLGVEK